MATIAVEHHPLQPFLPPAARLLMLGSFPPPRHRWSMDFFYPNHTNMMWQVMGEVFFGDSNHLVDAEHHTFHLDAIRAMLTHYGIALYDTATAVRRLSGNASDKHLEIVEHTDIPLLVGQLPRCHDIVCTGQKSFSVLTEDYGVALPPLGGCLPFTLPATAHLSTPRQMRLWRMPSTSRAYPMPLPQKAAYYRHLMQEVGLIDSSTEP